MAGASLNFGQRLWRDQRGNVLILTGLLFFILVGSAGAGIDLGRQQLVRIKMQQAADAASLAGALAPDGVDKATVAARYFRLNFPQEYMGVARPAPSISVSDSVRVTATATMDTYFVRHIGTESMTSTGDSVVGIEAAVAGQDYDMVLVMDNSGSMIYKLGSGASTDVPANLLANTRIAAYNRCADYYRGNQQAINAVCPNPRNQNQYNRFTYTWDRVTYSADEYYGLTGRNRLNALRSAANTISSQLLSDPDTESRVAVVSWSEILIASRALSASLSDVSGFINTMYAFGGTNSTPGLARASELLAAATDATRVKAVVLITDGENNSPTYNTSSLQVCNTLKASGAIIYTIAYGQLDSTARNFLSRCASGTGGSNQDEYFFIAPDGSTLQSVFQIIFTSVKKVRIIQ